MQIVGHKEVVAHFEQVNNTHRRVLFNLFALGYDKKTYAVKGVVETITRNKEHIRKLNASLN